MSVPHPRPAPLLGELLTAATAPASLHAALVGAAAASLGARSVALHLHDPASGRLGLAAASGSGPAPVGRVAPVVAADGTALGRLTSSDGDDDRLAAWGLRVAAALEAHAADCEREREAAALARLATLAAAVAGNPSAVPAAVCAAAREALGFAVVEAAVVQDGALATVAATGDPALLSGLPEEALPGLLAAATQGDGCHLLPATHAPAAWPPPPAAGSGPRAWREHSALVALRDRAGAIVGVLRAAGPSGGVHPPRGRLRLLAAFAAQAAAALAVERAGRRAQEAAGTLLEAALDAVVTIDADGRLLALNAAAERTLRLRREDVLGRDAVAVLAAPERRELIRQALADGGHGLVRGRYETVLLRADGRELPVELSVARAEVRGRPAYTAFLRDLSESVEARDERDRARHDTLTGLPNRRGVEARLRALAAQPDPPAGVGALHVVVSDFRSVNDSLGHAAGDEVLRLLGARLAEELDGTLVARLDGASFLVLLEQLRGDGLAVASATARWVHDTLTRPFSVEGLEVALQASVGVAVLPPAQAAGGELLKRADVAVGRAKAAGGGTAVFSPDADDARRRLTLAVELRRALARDELELHFQPLVRMRDPARAELGGLEALVRWRRADGTLVPPGDFIPFAEASGLIEPLGEWVLEEACRQTRAWLDAGLPSVPVGVNVSPRQLRRPGLARRIAKTLARHAIEPRSIVLEITESALRGDGGRLEQGVHQLVDAGLRWALDDFGADWSSLSRLRELPVELLKVDRAFLQQVPRDARARGLLEAILALAEALGARTVVEGIESRAQLDFLATTSCSLGQGFLLGRPAPADATEALLAEEGRRREEASRG